MHPKQSVIKTTMHSAKVVPYKKVLAPKLMKAAAVGKSWDDVFPDDHSLEFPIPKGCDALNNDVDGQATPTRHWRSKSAPEEEEPSLNWDISPRAFQQLKEGLKRIREDIDGKERPAKNDRRIALERDVAHLQMKLRGEKAAKDVLEQALGRASSVLFPAQSNFASQKTRDLVREIALLELEVAHLEQHLLSLYRQAFEQQLQSLANNTKAMGLCQESKTEGNQLQQRAGVKVVNEKNPSRNHRHCSSPLGSFSNSFNGYSFIESKGRQCTSLCSTPSKDQRLHSSYSQPISIPQESYGSPTQMFPGFTQNEVAPIESLKNTIFQGTHSGNLAKIFSPFVGEQIPETPNKLSEELVRCMAAIYCKLADPPLPHLGGSVSPSSSSSASTFSPWDFSSSDGWSPKGRAELSCESSLGDPFQGKGVAESVEAYNSMVEVPWIRVDNKRLTYAARMLHKFRSLVQQLEKVDPSQMKHEEKLAFWINIYNSLMMHAYLAYGIPRSQLKRVKLLQKAAYKIGAYSINGHTIEQSILGCRSHRPGQWLQTLLSPVAKFRGDECQACALDSPELLVCFALCCGGRSDPAVRVYTPRNIYHELDIAKRDFLQANISIHKGNKVLVPKILETFSKESSFGLSGLLEWVCGNVPEKQQIAIKKCMQWKSHKCIEWVPYNFSFRYIFVRDLARWFPPAAP